MHYYQFNIGDFIKDSAHLSLEEEAIYRRLIDHYYTTEKPISLDINIVSRAIRARGKEDLIELILNEFFVKSEKGFKQKRIEKELKNYKEKSKKAAASAKARWNKASSDTINNANAMRTHSEGNANHKPLTNNHKPIKREEAKASLPDGLNLEVWNIWLNHRKKLKLKKYTSDLCARKLAKLNHEQQKQCVLHSVENNYQGLFPERFENGQNGNSKPARKSAAERTLENIQRDAQQGSLS